MRTEEKATVRNGVAKMLASLLALVIQVGWVVLLFVRLNEYSTSISLLTSLLAFLLAVRISGKRDNAAFKLSWIILIMAFPLLGLCLYLLFGRSGTTRRMRRRFEAIDGKLRPFQQQRPEPMQALEASDPQFAGQCRYIYQYGHYPLYCNTDVVFYAEAVDGLEAQLKDLAAAEQFIFLEYHAIQEGVAFARLKAVLADRVAHGVEVRMFYDEVGSVGFIDRGFIRRMEEVGVQCRVFNPVVPVLKPFMNNRDHRKITVIDGKIGYTGGYNLADEYFGITTPFGRWKDTGLRLTGDAVQSLTLMFLEMWNAMEDTDASYTRYLPDVIYQASQPGFVQPYADSPLDDEYMGENIYLNLIHSATRYLYIATPYLIISDEMTRALCLAAQGGGRAHPDPRHSGQEAGVPHDLLLLRGTGAPGRAHLRVHPGFPHEKQVLCDGIAATVGTINFDFRSLYHHFENGVLLYRCPAIQDIEADFRKTFLVSQEVTEQYRTGLNAMVWVTQCLFRLFGPLM
ncbi:MAG: phospholipase D-like domain-containing protein [Clostridiales bacterium]|nr:phospholipase D-like domain-containing protein [Clostridiales bacterium]